MVVTWDSRVETLKAFVRRVEVDVAVGSDYQARKVHSLLGGSLRKSQYLIRRLRGPVRKSKPRAKVEAVG